MKSKVKKIKKVATTKKSKKLSNMVEESSSNLEEIFISQ